MAGEIEIEEGSPNLEAVPDAEGEPKKHSNPDALIPKARFDEVNDRRITAERELDKLRKADEKRQRQELEAQGKHEELIQQLEPKAQRADVLEAALQHYLDLELAAIPEDKRDLITDLSLDVAEKLRFIAEAKAKGLFATPEAVIAKPLPVPTNAGEGRRVEGSSANYGLSQIEVEAANMSGMTLEEYASFKSKQRR